MKSLHLLIFMISISFLSCSTDEAMESNNESTDQLEVYEAIDLVAFKIDKNPLNMEDRELTILDDIAEARLVGLGEATHGTKEFFQMKHRIFKYLVENHGYDAILFEMDLAEGRIFNDWVQWRRNDDITTLMADKMLFTWVWHTKEVRALLEYIRSYNQGKEEINMVGFYGVDTQFPDYDLDQYVEILRAANISEADSVQFVNEIYYKVNEFSALQLSSARLAQLENGLNFAKQVLSENEDKIRNALGDQDLLWAKQLVRHMAQVQENYIKRRLNNNITLRDKFMAENSSWYFDLLGQDSKFVLWAHNAHLDNNNIFLSQGYHLKQGFGEDYQILGFSFAKGKFMARDAESFELLVHSIDEDPPKNSFNSILYQADLDNYILPLHTQDPVITDWLETKESFLTIGAVFDGSTSRYYDRINIKDRYDYIVHFDETNNTEVLDR